jgi:hypothetical protein
LPAQRGLLVFLRFSSLFAVLIDPTTKSMLEIPREPGSVEAFTSVISDNNGDYWATDRNGRFGRINMRTQTLENSIPLAQRIPAMSRMDDDVIAIDRNSRLVGLFEPRDGSFTPLTANALSCCGSWGIAVDGALVYLSNRQNGVVSLSTFDTNSGEFATPVVVTGTQGFLHIEEMRVLDGVLYATTTQSRLIKIDPITGASTEILTLPGRGNAMEVLE